MLMFLLLHDFQVHASFLPGFQVIMHCMILPFLESEAPPEALTKGAENVETSDSDWR